MIFGGIITSAKNVELFNRSMELYRNAHNLHAELKWGKVSAGKLKEYKALIDLYFSCSRGFHFKSIIIDTYQIDHNKFNQGDKELGFYKFMYQFLLHSFGRYARNEDKYLVYLDQRNTSYPLLQLKLILNRGLKKKYLQIRSDVVRNIQPIDSKKSELLQVADILMGAIGYQKNGCHTRTNASKAKVSLAEYISQKANILSLCQNTPYSKKDFCIWNFRLQK
jgi:hypothetical protein